MKRGRILVVGLIGLLMASGLVLARCGDDECTIACELTTWSGGNQSRSSCNRGDCAVVKAINSGGSNAICSCN